ncbi:MAG: helix-turn-helix domain-containing protein [Chloroflexi bacterium]|nr:helix-turn-helix domain-containing protein [Chloroflexota bacterium]
MSRTLRFGVQIDVADAFWVLVREAIYQCAQRQAVDVFPLDVNSPHTLPINEQLSLIDEWLAQELDAIICLDWPESLAQRALQFDIPIVHLSESNIRHAQFVSPTGLYDIARDLGVFLAQQLHGRGNVLAVGGQLHHPGEDGKSRLMGITDALHAYPDMHLRHLPSLWTYEHACQQIRDTAWPPGEHFDAVFGLSDSIALAASDVGRELGLIDDRTIVVGINGDPLALAAIVTGTLTATVLTSTTDLAEQAVDLACRAARQEPLPAHFSFKPTFVTADNVSEIAARKLVAIANLPSRLIGDNTRQAQQRLSQLETSLKINQQVGAVLDRRQLTHLIADLIRVSYGYDGVRLYLWDEATRALHLEASDTVQPEPHLTLDATGLLAEALRGHEPIFIPDTQHSHRFPVDPDWPHTRSRVIVPIQFASKIIGLLDLHSYAARQHARQDLIGLQALADQLGIAMRNAELYGDAVEARAAAEKADQLKTRLLANVSHELRTPLNIILGYTATALASPNPYQVDLPPALTRDLQQIYGSGEHLLRLINDLLDLSRAEINELDLFPETIEPRAFLQETFHSFTASRTARAAVQWRLALPEHLPVIQADPVRFRQILFNLLSNANKFTAQGQIVLGAEVAPPHLHVWVQDTGEGIPIEMQERIFEPFVTSLQAKRRNEGIGLGLSVTRRLVLLHGGTVTLESQPGRGSTFHLYLPLPSLSGQPLVVPANAQPTLVVLSAVETLPEAVLDLSRRQGWSIHRVQSSADLSTLLNKLLPVALAWDLTHANLTDWDLIQKIRSLPQLAQLPFILYGAERPAVPDSGAGVTDFLVKPLNRQTLLDTIGALRPTTDAGLILIVDDDAQARDLYARLIAEAFPGCVIRRAEDGAVALKILDEVTPVLVILDLQMPNVDGFAVLEQLRARSATRRTPVLVMSGRALSFDDVQRLDQLYVTFQSKHLLSEDETTAALRRALAADKALPPQTSIVVKQTLAYLQQNYHRALSRQELASAVGVSKDYLSHIFQQELGLSPWEYLNRYRIQQAKALLSNSRASITDIAAQVGFDDLSYFNRVFRKQEGRTPSQYREHPDLQ